MEAIGDHGSVVPSAAAPRELSSADVLARVLAAARERVSTEQFRMWFSRLRIRRSAHDQVTFLVGTAFEREYLVMRYGAILEEGVRRVLGPEARFGIESEPGLFSVEEARKALLPRPVHSEASAAKEATPPPAASAASERDGRFDLNPLFTFDQFVASPLNRLPLAAAQSICQSTERIYNPLFLHGHVGLGKTHLLQAIGQGLRSRDSGTPFRYLSCETFTNEYIQALRHGSVADFRQRCRTLDYLLLDDVDFLSNKERTQEEFFHTFNALYLAGKQIVLTSDCPPDEIPSISERLVSRFRSGMVLEIRPPDFETRVAIVEKKSSLWGVSIPSEVARLVAERVTANVRDLEGAAVRVVGQASLAKRPVTVELAMEVLRQLPSGERKPVTIESILEAVGRHFHVKPSDLRGRRRIRSISTPRQVCMYLARELTHSSLEEIGNHFGRDHSTVLYACSKVRGEIGCESALRNRVDRLLAELR